MDLEYETQRYFLENVLGGYAGQGGYGVFFLYFLTFIISFIIFSIIVFLILNKIIKRYSNKKMLLITIVFLILYFTINIMIAHFYLMFIVLFLPTNQLIFSKIKRKK
jgi:hypothetical protein